MAKWRTERPGFHQAEVGCLRLRVESPKVTSRDTAVWSICVPMSVGEGEVLLDSGPRLQTEPKLSAAQAKRAAMTAARKMAIQMLYDLETLEL